MANEENYAIDCVKFSGFCLKQFYKRHNDSLTKQALQQIQTLAVGIASENWPVKLPLLIYFDAGALALVVGKSATLARRHTITGLKKSRI